MRRLFQNIIPYYTTTTDELKTTVGAHSTVRFYPKPLIDMIKRFSTYIHKHDGASLLLVCAVLPRIYCC
jgi:hypothetical protein